MYGQGGKAAIAAMNTQPPRERIDYPLYDFVRNYPWKFVPQYLQYPVRHSDENVMNMLPFQYYRQPLGGGRVTPTMISRLRSGLAVIPASAKRANLGSS